MRIGRIRLSHLDQFLDIGSLVESAAQARFPRRIIFGVDTLPIAARLLSPLLFRQFNITPVYSSDGGSCLVAPEKMLR